MQIIECFSNTYNKSSIDKNSVNLMVFKYADYHQLLQMLETVKQYEKKSEDFWGI